MVMKTNDYILKAFEKCPNPDQCAVIESEPDSQLVSGTVSQSLRGTK